MIQPSSVCPLTANQYHRYLVRMAQRLSNESNEVPNTAALICTARCPDKAGLFAGYLQLREQMNQIQVALEALEMLCGITGDERLDGYRFEFEVMVTALERAMNDFKSHFIVQGETMKEDVSGRLHRLEAQMIRLNKLPGFVRTAFADELAKRSERDVQAKLKLLNDKEAIIYEACADYGPLQGEALMKKAGYPYSTSSKATLSRLVKLGLLESTVTGYRVVRTAN